MNVNYLVFVTSYALFILFGFMLIVELINIPSMIPLMLYCALTSGFYGIQKKFKQKVYPKKESKFKSNFKRRI